MIKTWLFTFLNKKIILRKLALLYIGILAMELFFIVERKLRSVYLLINMDLLSNFFSRVIFL